MKPSLGDQKPSLGRARELITANNVRLTTVCAGGDDIEVQPDDGADVQLQLYKALGCIGSAESHGGDRNDSMQALPAFTR